MVKHILSTSIYEIGILYAIVFGGENFYPEPDVHYRFDRPDVPYVYPGRMYDWDNTELYAKFFDEEGYSRHFTNVFNVFVVI